MGTSRAVEFSSEHVRGELERILSADAFRAAPALGNMLAFVVGQTLEGNAGHLKEYTLGSETLGRGPNFDPRIDPIVRVQARRVRAKLDQFYTESGARPPVRISFPKGGYIPTFELVEARAGSGNTHSEITSIGILPFENLTSDSNNTVLSDGLTENLIRALTRFERLRVLARTSAFAYKRRDADVRQICADLGITHLLDGQLRQAGSQLAVSVQMRDAATGSTTWSRVCEAPSSQFVQLQDEITHLVTQFLGKETDGAAPMVAKLDAYQLYSQGRYYWRQRTPESIRKALDYFERAKKADSHCALAYAGIADCYMIAGMYGAYPPQLVFPPAKSMAQRAVELDPALGEAHASLGLVAAAFDWDYEAAEAAFDRALQLNPGYSTAHHWRAVMFLAPHGCFHEAIAQLRLAARSDPLSSVVRADLACVLQIAGKGSEALAACEASLGLDAACVRSLWVKAYILERQGQYAPALDTLARLSALTTDREKDPLVASSMAMVKSLSGDRRGAEMQLQVLLEAARRRYVSEYCMAVAFLAAGDTSAALHWLNTACHQHCGGINWLSVDPRWQPIATSKEFAGLLSKLNLLSFQLA